MHRNIGNDNEGASKDTEADNVLPQRQIVEAKSAQNAGSRHFDVESISVVFETQPGDLVDNESFVAIVEDRQLFPGGLVQLMQTGSRMLTVCSH